MRRFLSLVMVLLMLTLAGCGAGTAATKPSEPAQSPSSSAAPTETLMEGAQTETAAASVQTGLIAEQILSGTEGDIHYSYYLPESYDGSRKFPMMMVMPGYDIMWFGEESSGSNLNWSGFAAWTKLDTEMIVVSAQLTDWHVHEPIIDRETFEAVQKLISKTKRRAPKKENAEKNMFCDLLYCADCGSKLWSHVNTVNKNIQYFSCSNYKTDTRGTCETRHYIRADAIEQVVMLELRRMAQFLQDDEEAFAELLAQKTNKDILKEQKYLEDELRKSVARSEKVSGLYEKLYEDNASGKVTDEWFMQLSHKYEVERMELKAKIADLRQRISNIGTMQQNKENFINAIRRFMEMKKLTAPLLRELIDKITVYETEGVGKNRSQRVMIHYKFIGYIEIPECGKNYRADTRKGVAVEYVTKSA